MSTRTWVLSLVLLGVAGCGSDPEPGPAPTAAPTTATAAVDADLAVHGATSGHAAAVAGARRFDPAVARLQGPHFAYSVTAVGRVRGPVPARLSSAFGLAAGAAPAAGQELLLVDLARTAGEPALLPDPAEPLGVEVAAGEVTRTVPVAPPGDLSGTIAVSVPAGARPVLRIADAGRRQSLDLTTGRRGADAVAGYYPVRGGSWDAGYGQPTGLLLYGAGVAGLSRDDRAASIQLDDTAARLQPHVPARGWAKRGRAWLVLDASFAYGRRSGSPTEQDTVTAPPACFRVTGPDGAPIPLAGDPLVLGAADAAPTSGAIADGQLTADVPAALRQVTVRFAFCGSIRTPAGDVTYSVYANPAQTAAITLR